MFSCKMTHMQVNQPSKHLLTEFYDSQIVTKLVASRITLLAILLGFEGRV